MNPTDIFNLLQIVQNELEAVNQHALADDIKLVKKDVADEFSLI